ncbi:protein kinase domain-containing protein [Paraliomyxa miuraensis]|uniref:protein kinase domain-containing protein n=1 Tax=Paraliomyxa miuraensis TaxID=376150 RepID=UPI00224D75B2|nr:serine/threonine-protein kinase [Paraliomyxa miuraensis]MCX4240018.1 serine/threonine protein kinase [Paraliomyxa miuraensis]
MVESLQRLVPPRRLGKFQLMARRGEGGMATVYVAAVGEGSLARLAAVKLLRQGAPDHDFRTRFLDEAKVVVRLHHNNIVDVREAGEVGGQLYIAMELIEGRDLADVWDRCAEVGRAFPVPLAVHIVREVLRGLHYAHTFPGLGLVHRDVSPSNILIDWAGAVRLADFGLATSAMKASLTVPGMVFGKVGYMAPEQATRSPLDGRADVYGCGVVLWELLTGRPLRDSETDTQAVAGWDAMPPSSLSNRVDEELDDIVMTALQRSREERYQSAGDFMEALSIWLSEHAPDTTQERMADFMNRLFGEARERDHESYSVLMDDLEAMALAGAAGGAGDIELLDDADVDDEEMIGAPPRGGAARPVPTDGETIAPGTIIAQRYRVAEPLGRGGMGTVYLAEHITVGRKVAIKVLTHEWSEHEVVARRFKEEARAASAAGHPNIIEVFDAGELPDRRLFIVMEFLTGRSLYEELVELGPLDVLRACRIIRDVARAVRAAHGVGIIHRDLKPDNIMLVNRGEGEMVKVLDFGISASADRTPEEQRLTIPGRALGTPEYMAPEQSKGRPPTEQFDIYAMGVMLYEALAGEPPFVSENVVEVLARKATEAPPRLDMRRAGLPPPLVELVHACIAVDPNRRPASTDEFLGVLEPIVAALEGMQAMEVSSSGRFMRDGAPVTALALPGRLPPFGPPPMYDSGGLPPPPAYDAFDESLSRVHSRPHANDSLLSTPVDVDYAMGGPSRKAWWVLASVGLVLLLLLTVGVWWQMLREKNATEGSPNDGLVAEGGKAAGDDGKAAGDDGKVAGDDGKAAGDDGKAVKPAPGTGGTEPDGSSGPEDDGKADAAGDDGQASADGGAVEKNPLESAKCKRTRQSAHDAYKRRAWKEMLSHLGSRTCWKGKYRGDYADMKIKGLFENKQFAECAKLVKAARSNEAKTTAKNCQQRAAMGG